jgi:excisionase family DNA binding protein
MKPFIVESEQPLPERMAFTAKEAAHALGISERTLADRTKDSKIPIVTLGGRVLYPIRELEDWIKANVRVLDGGTNSPLNRRTTKKRSTGVQ